jgi:IS30 family transposase
MKYKHLSQEERDQIAIMLYEKIPKKKIAEKLQRDYSTIYREIKRNHTSINRKYNNSPKKKKFIYLPYKAQKKYQQRRKKSKSPFPLKNPFIYRFTTEHLKKGWSPELISGRLQFLYGEKHSISHECIYQFIYSKRGRRMQLCKYLPRRHKKRRKHNGRSTRRHLIPNRTDISLRPKEVEDREVAGHWEGDSIVGVGKGSALHTEVERHSRYLLIRKKKRKTAEETATVMTEMYLSVPKHLRKTTTADNGSEFCSHEKVTKKTKIQIFFARPYHSWERGSNENANGLVRRFFPKKTNFDPISKQEIQAVQNAINHRPKKCLEFRTPHEVFTELCSNAP